MSAFLVDPYHIGQIVRYNKDSKPSYSPFSHQDRDAMAQCLAEANLRSIHARYHSSHHQMNPFDTDAEYVRACIDEASRDDLPPLSPIQLLKAIDCLAYQSCEYDGWEYSQAKKYLDDMTHQAVSRLPGYNEADWELTDPACVAA
jgi:hypothetical protein